MYPLSRAVGSPRATILCIDDEKVGLTIRTAVLEAAGYRVFAAGTADAAMALFVEHKIDLVISDHLLGRVSGGDVSVVMKHVRPGVSVMLLSGDLESVPDAVKQQMDSLVQKGGTTKDFLETITNTLAKRPA